MKEKYLTFLKKQKLELDKEYKTNFQIKGLFGNLIDVDRVTFSYLDNKTSPLLVCSFFENGEIYFAIKELITDIYDKKSIIDNMEQISNLCTYDIKNLKKLKLEK